MNYYVDQVFRLIYQIFDATSKWSMPVWCTLGVIGVTIGFLLLRGNMLRGA